VWSGGLAAGIATRIFTGLLTHADMNNPMGREGKRNRAATASSPPLVRYRSLFAFKKKFGAGPATWRARRRPPVVADRLGDADQRIGGVAQLLRPKR